MQAIEFTEGNGFTTETQKARSRSTEKLPPKSFDRAHAEVPTKWDDTEAVPPMKNPAIQDFFTAISLLIEGITAEADS